MQSTGFLTHPSGRCLEMLAVTCVILYQECQEQSSVLLEVGLMSYWFLEQSTVLSEIYKN